MKMVLSWGQLIYIYFPIPVFCLALLSLTWPPKLDRFGSNLVSKIFFTELRAGPVRVKLLHFFFVTSVLVFAGTVRRLHLGVLPCKTCVYAGETLWYNKAMKFRAERNFWLSLFNVILWMLVWTVHHDRRAVRKLKDELSRLKADLAALAVAADASKAESSAVSSAPTPAALATTTTTTTTTRGGEHSEGNGLIEMVETDTRNRKKDEESKKKD